ncbi:hypothetical protein MJL48_29625, partial [Salmonella enterica subsp. enterica serovar Kentucky]|nr:hypothetical protein [Salmonella enterica subsp. enterica serovar Kentucky]
MAGIPTNRQTIILNISIPYYQDFTTKTLSELAAITLSSFNATSFIVAAVTCLFDFTLSPRLGTAGADLSLVTLIENIFI